MVKKATEIVGANVERLMRHAQLSNAAVERKTSRRVKRSTLDRVRRGQGSPGIDSLAEIARAFGVELWQLLVPSFDPECPPSLGGAGGEEMTPRERMLLARFRNLNPAFQQLVLNDLERYLEAEAQTAAEKGEPGSRQA